MVHIGLGWRWLALEFRAMPLSLCAGFSFLDICLSSAIAIGSRLLVADSLFRGTDERRGCFDMLRRKSLCGVDDHFSWRSCITSWR